MPLKSVIFVFGKTGQIYTNLCGTESEKDKIMLIVCNYGVQHLIVCHLIAYLELRILMTKFRFLTMDEEKSAEMNHKRHMLHNI